ncbi:MAG: hypothetical protein U0790_19145 [Isosphaeraceae bacterium]
MDYREHPRTAAAEPRLDGVIGDPVSRPRLRRFDFRRSGRQLDLPRVVLAGLILLGVVSITGYLGLRAARTAIRWLHQQPQYQIPFREIRLRPEAPAWFRGGTEAFLGQVRERSREPEVLSVLDLERGQLTRAFQDYSPWVEEVVRIEYPPGEIVVDLVYKRPVAILGSAPGEVSYLDRNGHLLPGEDFDPELLGPLIRITGTQLVPSPRNHPGGIWKSAVDGSESARLERCVRAAAGLAGFLLEPDRLAERSSSRVLQVVSIFATDERGLFIRTAEGVMVLWGEAPGQEPAGTLTAAQKWETFKRWAATSPRRAVAPGGYWMFSRSDLKPVEPGTGRP